MPARQEDSLSNDEVLEAALHHAQAYLAGLQNERVGAAANLATLRSAMGKELTEKGVAALQVVDELARDATPGLIRSSGGRFFGWVIGGTMPAALAADWLTSAWDQNSVLSATSPAAAMAEEVAGEWIKDLLRLPPQSSFAFVTGCQMAHVTCLAAARTALLQKMGWDVVEQGLTGAPRIRVLVSESRHASIDRAVSLLGLGTANVETLATDELGRIHTAALRDRLANDSSTPTIVTLQAGDIATGAFDRFSELIPIARAAGAWVHIDGAFGLWARASARYRELANQCEMADSWATDGHKILNTPFDCGYAIIAHPEAHRTAFALRASYLTHAEDARDQIDWNPDWSRRSRGFPTYAVLRNLGREGVAKLFERLCEHTRTLAGELAKLPGVELVSEPIVNQALVRFHLPELDSDGVIEAINRSGEAFFTGATWRGERVMRISVCSWRTTSEDVERAVSAVRSVLEALHVNFENERP